MPAHPPLKPTTSRKLRSVLDNPARAAIPGEEEKHKATTKAEERATRALADARDRSKRSIVTRDTRYGVVENPLRKLEREERERHLQNKTKRSTSIARLKRHGAQEEEEEEEAAEIESWEEMELREEKALDRSAAQARLGIAPPLPRSILRPEKKSQRKEELL
jgi:hypothetical protein